MQAGTGEFCRRQDRFDVDEAPAFNGFPDPVGDRPFDERPVQGRVMATIVGGRIIYRDDAFAPEAAAA